jgi:hypothetical protein
MKLRQLCRTPDELVSGRALRVPRDRVSSNMEGADETERDVKTIELKAPHPSF